MKHAKIYSLCLMLVTSLTLTASATPKAKSTATATATHLTFAQKSAVKKIVDELVETEKFTGDATLVPLYEDRVEFLTEDVDPLIAKLPGGDMRKCFALAVQTHQDLSTILGETTKYPYYDLIQDKQTPKLIKKYGLNVDLHSSLPYGKLEASKITYITGLLTQVAVLLRQRAQNDLKH